ncbi:MAG TPA: hypothetical protein VE153_06565 [Myxococcus sp.]|nr:hypothetical protein [Myxococcus sp.]
MTRTPWIVAGAAALLLVTGCSDKDKAQSGAGAQQDTAQPSAQAQAPAAQAPSAGPEAATPPGAMSISGQVTAAAAGGIKVKSAAGEAIFMQLNDQTQVFINGRQGAISDVTQGAEVRASFQPPSGATPPTALRVDVMDNAR